jgi:hypothetical protein
MRRTTIMMGILTKRNHSVEMPMDRPDRRLRPDSFVWGSIPRGFDIGKLSFLSAVVMATSSISCMRVSGVGREAMTAVADGIEIWGNACLCIQIKFLNVSRIFMRLEFCFRLR